ncbi:type III secretion protein U [Collimonas sp. OK242]|jgi:type III secretion protein U|uniref:type III secretion system export apparatus subunit SctU n=1 Tax=Collimonas sp. OK242 TaxID=1798195 RepID=UPI0008975B9F|nr:type III secretion system export apparatus subunit SctU [Collimonas sp. OK242]SDY72988.1 type III secretion protein U [Collimonas sp. OK242]
MSDSSSSQSKTEQPTPKKLHDLRRKGDIPVSQDLVSALSMLVVSVALAMTGKSFIQNMMGLINQALNMDWRSMKDPDAVLHATKNMFVEGIGFSLPLIALLIFTSIAIGLLQSRGLLVITRVMPDLKRLNPITGMQRIFSLRTVFELFKLLSKSILLGLIVFLLTRQILGILFDARFLPIAGVLFLAEKVIGQLFWMSLAAFIVFAIADFSFQRWDFTRKNRMTKDEVKREYKEMEGDPHLRAKRRQLQQELSMQTMLDNVRKANVVVVNPTHIAVALYYNQDETAIPVVLAKGEGFIAEEIRRVAQEEGIPILRDIQLARQLQAKVPVNHYIPDDLIEPVAAVLRWVRDIKPDA